MSVLRKFFRSGSFFYLVLSVALAALWIRYVGRAPTRTLPGDFGVYHLAWERYAQGLDPYRADEYSAFKYSPAFLACMGLLPKDPIFAWQIFGTLLLAGLGGAFLLGTRRDDPARGGKLLLGWILAWKGILETFDYGQAEPILIVITVLAAFFEKRRNGAVTGFLLGLLPALKLPWLLLAVPFGIRRGLERLPLGPLLWGYGTAVVGWAMILPAVAFGPSRAWSLTQSWRYLLAHQPSQLFTVDINQSLWMQAQRWWGAGPFAVGFSWVVLGLLLAWLIRNLERLPARAGAFDWLPSWWLFGQLVSPLAWRWGSVVAIGAPWAASGRSRRVRQILWAGIAILWLLQLNPVVKALGSGLGYEHWTDLHRTGVITLYWLLLAAL